MPKVTVIVPTYRSSGHLDDLVASIDRQTMPQADIEVLLIDDGSPDDTFARLQAFAAARPGYRAISLPASGWPSRPRNHGIDEARGEYVVFIDHDDRLFPDALRAAYELAVHAGADVLDGKESKSNTPGWAMRDVDANVDNAIDWIEPHPLLPMNPHKMFRTQFLRDRGIRFPEGGRQIWEDISFDIAAHARADVVSLLVETPFYFWHRPAQATTSATFEDDLGEYLAAIGRVFDWVDAELGTQERFAELYPRFLAYQLRMRVLPLFSKKKRTEDDLLQIRAFTTAVLARVRPDADVHLDPWRRIKAALLRAGRFDLVDLHETTVPRLICVPRADAVRWTADGLDADVTLEWELRSGERSVVEAAGGRHRLRLHPRVAAFAAEHGLTDDVTDGLAETTWVIERRSRAEKIDWNLLRGDRPPVAADPDAGPLMRTSTAVTWPLVDDGPGRLHRGVWDFHARTVVLWTRVVRQITAPRLDGHRWAAVAGHLAAAYRSQNGNLAVDVDQSMLHVVDDAPGAPIPGAAPGAFTLPLTHVSVFAPLTLEGTLVRTDGEQVVGRCRAEFTAAGAALTGTLDAGVTAPFRVDLAGARSRTRFRVDARGAVRILAPERPSLARRAWEKLPASVRRRVWRLRHAR